MADYPCTPTSSSTHPTGSTLGPAGTNDNATRHPTHAVMQHAHQVIADNPVKPHTPLTGSVAG